MMRLVLIALVTIVVGGGIVGFVLYQNAQPDDLPRAAGSRQLADFLVQEHKAAANAGSTEQFTARTSEQVTERTGVWIGRQMEFDETLFAEDSGLQFHGARESQVPGPGRSVHMLFSTEGGTWVSVFLQQYRQLPELERGKAYTLAAPRDAAPIVVWVPQGQIHYLVSERPEGIEAVRKALQAPAPDARYPG